MFGDYLCGVEPPMLDFHTQSAQYSSLVEPPSLSEKTTARVIDSGDVSKSGDTYTDAGDLIQALVLVLLLCRLTPPTSAGDGVCRVRFGEECKRRRGRGWY
mgnify:CR=1 FL=1